MSRTQTWQECQMKYKFRYHLKTPSPEAEPPYFLYGTLVHRIAEEFVKSKGKRNINDIKKLCLDGDILLEEGSHVIPRKVLPTEYINKLSGHLISIMKSVVKFGFEGECEYHFDYDLCPPQKKFINGKIDRLIQKDGKFVILDYKTTKQGYWRKSKRDIVGDLQLQCYAMVVAERFKVDPSAIYAALLYLEGSELVGAQFTQQTLNQCRDNLIKIYDNIETSDPDKVIGSVNKQCERCEFKTICPSLKIIN